MANKLVFTQFKKETLAIDGRKQAVGSISYHKRWGQHVFTPHVGNKLGKSQLEEILNHVIELNRKVALSENLPQPKAFTPNKGAVENLGQQPEGSQNDQKAGS